MGMDATDVLESVEVDAIDWELEPAGAVVAFGLGRLSMQFVFAGVQTGS